MNIIDKYKIESANNKTKLPFDLFNKLCNLDPTIKPNKVGKYSNWILQKYNPNVDLDQLRIYLEWYVDGIKRNILQREGISSDINSFKSYNDFISAIQDKMQFNDIQLSNSEISHRERLDGQFEIIGSTSKFDIIKPLTFEAERYFGSGTKWCTVANRSYFNSYIKKSSLYIIYPKNGNNKLKMQFHTKSYSFADYNDNVYNIITKCIFSIFDESDNDALELRNLCKNLFNSKYIGMTINEKLESLKTITKIPDKYFVHSNIKEIVIPDNIISIGDSAFSSCTSLTSVTIPDSVTSIGDSAFSSCSRLISINIPDRVTSIGKSAFYNCTGLTSVTIGNSVTSIGSGAFYDCTSLTSVTIGNSVTSIGSYVFFNCTSLKRVTIPDSVITIGSYAFYNCTSLKRVTIPDSVTSIGNGAFRSCTGLTSIAIPDSVTSIGESAFYGCRSLTSIYCKPTTPPTLGSYAFDYVASSAKIYVPIGLLYLYQQQWKNLTDKLVEINFNRL